MRIKERRKIGQIFQVFLWEKSSKIFPLAANEAGAHRSKKEWKQTLGWGRIRVVAILFSNPTSPPHFDKINSTLPFFIPFLVVGGRCNMKIYRFSFILSSSLSRSRFFPYSWMIFSHSHAPFPLNFRKTQAAKWMRTRLWCRNRKTATSRGRRKNLARSLLCDMVAGLRRRTDPMRSPLLVPYLDARNATKTSMASNTIQRTAIKRMESE